MKIGDYVRTECGIAKIKNFETKNKEVINLDKDIMICNMDCYRNCCTINQVIKSSPNIIDLIEVGDFITYKKGNMYIDIPYRVYGTYNEILEETELRIDDEYLKDIEILSIVTHEQFEAIEYKIGDEK